MTAMTKKATNVSIRTDLLEAACAYKINLSQTLEAALATEVKKVRERQWLEENRAAIDAYNREVSEYGLFSDRFRTFCRDNVETD